MKHLFVAAVALALSVPAFAKTTTAPHTKHTAHHATAKPSVKKPAHHKPAAHKTTAHTHHKAPKA